MQTTHFYIQVWVFNPVHWLH